MVKIKREIARDRDSQRDRKRKKKERKKCLFFRGIEILSSASKVPAMSIYKVKTKSKH